MYKCVYVNKCIQKHEVRSSNFATQYTSLFPLALNFYHSENLLPSVFTHLFNPRVEQATL